MYIELETSRLLLKRVDIERDSKEINECVCDTIDTLKPWIPWAKKKPSVQDTKLGLQRVAGDVRHYCFRIYIKDKPSMIGQCGLVYFQEYLPEKVYEIGYWLHKDFTSNGYMTEAVQRLVLFASEDLKANKLFIVFNVKNIDSQKVAERCGFLYGKKFIEDSGSEMFEYQLRL